MSVVHGVRYRVFSAAVALCLAIILACLAAGTSLADTNVDVTRYLETHNTYISSQLPASSHISKGDIDRLEAQVRSASRLDVPEKIALVARFPSKYSSTYTAARGLRHFLDFSGVLVLVSPRGIGVSSDTLTLDEIQAVERKARPICLVSFTDCAVEAGHDAANRVHAAHQQT